MTHQTKDVRIWKKLSEGVQLNFLFFLVDEGREDPITTKNEPS